MKMKSLKQMAITSALWNVYLLSLEIGPVVYVIGLGLLAVGPVNIDNVWKYLLLEEEFKLDLDTHSLNWNLWIRWTDLLLIRKRISVIIPFCCRCSMLVQTHSHLSDLPQNPHQSSASLHSASSCSASVYLPDPSWKFYSTYFWLKSSLQKYSYFCPLP